MNTLIAYLTRNCCAGSTACDPACAPAAPAGPTVVAHIDVGAIAGAARNAVKS